MASKLLMAITGALAAAVVATPLAQATDDGTLLSRAWRTTTADGVSYPRLASEQGFSFATPTGWPIIRPGLVFPRLASGQGFSFPAPVGWPTVRPGSITPAATTDGGRLSKAADSYIAERALIYAKGFIDAASASLSRRPDRSAAGAATDSRPASRATADRAAHEELAKLDPGRIADAMVSAQAELVAARAGANRPDGFDWSDAGLGAGVAIGALVLLAASLMLPRRLRNRQMQTA